MLYESIYLLINCAILCFSASGALYLSSLNISVRSSGHIATVTNILCSLSAYCAFSLILRFMASLIYLYVLVYCSVSLLSMATFAVVCLYYAVAHRNAWFNAMLYLTTREKYPIQLILREILINNDTTSMVNAMDVGAGDSSFVSETVKCAVIIVSVVPVLCISIYPEIFHQRCYGRQ